MTWYAPIKCLLCKHEHTQTHLRLTCGYKMGWLSNPYFCKCEKYIKTNLDLVEYLAKKKKLIEEK